MALTGGRASDYRGSAVPEAALQPDSPSTDPVVAVIPARLGSTRFARKMLADRTGRPLVQHVVDQVRRCRRIDEVVVATDSAQIAEALEKFDVRVEMTSPDHPSGTDRVAEVAAAWPGAMDESIFLNVQGDEPEMDPAALDRLVELMQEDKPGGRPEMGTLATPFPGESALSDPNLVKVVLGMDGRALYFSRAPIPLDRDGTKLAKPLLHLGVYAYRRITLLKIAGLAPTPLEQTERLEQLRVLEHGHTIFVATVSQHNHGISHGIDTPEQYDAFVERWRSSGRHL